MCATERVVPNSNMPQKGSTTSGASKAKMEMFPGFGEDRLGKQQGNTGFGVADTILTVANRQRHRGHDQTRWDFVAPLLRTCLQRAY
jgi:hypothetical protein